MRSWHRSGFMIANPSRATQSSASSAILQGSLKLDSAIMDERRFVCEANSVIEFRRRRSTNVIGPDGSPLTIADLPAPGTTRLVIRRKAEVVAAVRGGLLSIDEACSRYSLTIEEFLAWQDSIDRHGLAGLRTTRIQLYRTKGSDPHRS
jgi:hypothetical protein